MQRTDLTTCRNDRQENNQLANLKTKARPASRIKGLFGILALCLPLTLHAAPNISIEPANTTVNVGSTATFSVSATGSGTLTYRWQRNGLGNLASTPTLSLPNVSLSQSGEAYTVIVTDVTGSVTSTPPAILTVLNPPVISSQPMNVVATVGDEGLFDVQVNGATPFHYQWAKNGIDIPNATNSDGSFDIDSVAVGDASGYSVVITNTDGITTSTVALLTVVEPSIAGSLPLNVPVNTCTNITLSVITHGTDTNLSYQWFFGAGMTPVGGNSSNLVISDVTFGNAGLYTVQVTTLDGSFDDASGTLTVTDPPPVVITKNITVDLDASGNVAITPSQVDNGSFDNCSIANMSVVPNSFMCVNVGSNLVTLSATDSSNQTAQATAVVTVRDLVPPTAAFNSISVQLDATGNYTLTPSDIMNITAGSSDACGIALTNVIPSSFTFCDAGSKSISVQLTDINGNVTTTNSIITVVAPVAAPSTVYVDASYGNSCGAVAFPNNGGSGPYFIGFNAFNSVQAAINHVLSGGTVNVAAGTNTENVTASKPVTLLGANQGVAGCATRGSESIISPSSGNALTVGATGVTVDGFELNGAVSVIDSGNAGLVVQNNTMNPTTAGVELIGITTGAGNGCTVQNNCITLASQLAGSTPTVGIGINTITGTQAPLIVSNNISGAFDGYVLFGLNASTPTVIQASSITGAMQGVAVLNINPLSPSIFGPSTFGINGVTVSGFSGNYPSLSSAGIDFHAGVYVFTSGSLSSAVLTGAITNVAVTGTSNISPDSAGLYFSDFSTGNGVRQNITVQNSTISANANRGISASGTNSILNVNESSILGNGFNPFGTGGNFGFGIIARNNAQVTVSECFIGNPATVTAPYTVRAVEADANTLPTGPTLVVTNCSIVNNGNTSGYLASQDAGTLNAPGNWWGTTSDTAITNLMLGSIDFTPYLDSGVDTDATKPGFQGDFSALHVTTLGTQFGGTGRIQEGINTVVGGTVYLQAGTFVEGPQILINKDITMIGDSTATTIIKPSGNTSNSGDAKGWWLVEPTEHFDLSKVTLDGTGKLVFQAIRSYGITAVDQVHFTHIQYNPSGPDYQGVGIVGFDDGTHAAVLNVSNSQLDNIGRIGIFYFGTNTSGTCQNNTYVGKGPGNWLDYGIELGSSASALILSNNVTGDKGVASVDGSVSAGITADSFFGPHTTATLRGNIVNGNSYGVAIGFTTGDTSDVLLEFNDLSGNDDDGLQVVGGATVDAGDCTGSNVTGLGTGSGPAGSSAGGNNLSGYGFDSASPWAIENLNGASPAVLAYGNSYGALVGNNLAALFSGNVLADQSGGLLVQYPGPLTFQCLSSVATAPGATDLAGFVAQGGTVSATTATVSYVDVVMSSNFPNHQVISRNYTITDPCSQSTTGSQIITVNDTTPPTVTGWPANRTLDVGAQCNVQVPDLVSEVTGASDNCGSVTVSQNPLANSLISIGTNLVTVTVTDEGGNSISTNVVLTVIDTRPAPITTYVDAAYTGLPTGTQVLWPAGTGSGPHYIGCDAFATVQGGVNRVATSGTVNVAAGVYGENVSVAIPLTLKGANAGVDPRITCRQGPARGAEAIIDGGGTDAALAVSANNVTVDGFTIQDGANGLNAGLWISGGVSNVSVYNNVVTNNAIGIAAASSGACVISTNLIAGNNLPGPSGGSGILGYANTVNLLISDNEFIGQTNNNPIQLDAAIAGPGYGTHVGLAVLRNNFHDNFNASAIYALGVTGGVIANNQIAADPTVTGIRFAGGNTNVAVSNNFVLTANVGVRLTDDGYSLPPNAAVTINGNSFGTIGSFAVSWESPAETGAGTGYAGPVLDASANWWGITTVSGIEAKIDNSGGPVDFTPWLDTGTPVDNNPCDGFNGDFSVLHVSEDSPQAGNTGRIQEGINDVVGGKVIIEQGLYTEEVVANKEDLELAGVGQGAVTIIPAESNPNPPPGAGSLPPGAINMILVQASGVTIHDLTIDGSNPALTTNGVSAGGVVINARNGIIEDFNSGTFNGTVVYNTTVRNIYLRGIYASSGGTNFFFHDNLVQNVQADPESVAMFNFAGSGVMSNNLVSAASDAISANNSTGTLFVNNTVTNSASGVHTDNSVGSDLLSGNHVFAMQPGAFGVWVFVPYTQITVENNVISDCFVGLASAGQGLATTPLFLNNQVSAGAGTGNMGAYETTSELGFGFTDVSTAFQGNTIQGTTFGFYLENTGGNNLSASITANNIVTGNQFGVYATNAPEFVKIENTDLRNNSTAAIYASGGATVDAGNCGADVTGLGASLGGNNLTGYLAGPALAVVNANSGGTPAVYAYDDSFGATGAQPEISSALSGNVLASQAGALFALSPNPANVQCPESVPLAANTLSGFQSIGGVVSATAVTVSNLDSALNPGPYDGVVLRTYFLTDACGQSTSVQQTITVQDTTAPTIDHCATNQTISADVTAHASLSDLRGEVIAHDNCIEPVTISQIPASGTIVPLGPTTVTLWATDQSGNSNSCTAIVTVVDTTPPALTCAPDVTVTVLQEKDPFATGTPNATDAGGPVTITYNDDRTGLTNCDTTGIIVRTWAATDPANNTSYCTQLVTVIDTNAPYFTFVPDNISVTNDPGLCSAVVTYATPTARDLGYFQDFTNAAWVSGSADTQPSTDWNDDSSHISRVLSGTDGIISRNGISHALIDSTSAELSDTTGAFGRLGGYSAVFGTGYHVALDVYIDLSDPKVQNATTSSGYTWDLAQGTTSQANGPLRDFIFHAAAYDASGVVIAADFNSGNSILSRGPDLRTFPTHAELTNSGWYTFQWNFRNNSNVMTADLSVVDTNGNVMFSQTLAQASDLVSTVAGGHRYLWFTFIDADKLPIGTTVLERNASVTESIASGSTIPVGTTTVTNTATDACGNSTNSTFTITVTDVEPPSANVPADITQTNDLGQCGAVVNFTLPAQTDNCGIASSNTIPASGTFFAVGTNVVTEVVTDIHGNSSTNTFNVIVNDTQPPSAIVPATIVQANDPGVCGAVVNFTLPSQTDNCGIASSNATPASGSFFPVGTNVVTVVVTDIHGNSATNTFNVVVNDTELPVVTCPANIIQSVDPGHTFATVSFTPTATDNCAVAMIVSTPPSGSQFPIGTNLVTVVATDIHGNTQNCTFTVQVVGLPQITQQPMNRTNNAGTTATFSVTATSPTPLSYFWEKNGVALSDTGNITGSHTAMLMIANVSDTDVAPYSVIVSNLAGTVLSSNATLTVIDPPAITQQPQSRTNNATTTATFTITLAGNSTPPFGYQWFKNDTNLLVDGGNISGATSPTLTISNVLAADDGEYSVVVTNVAGTATSSNATLVVIDPVILVQPMDVTAPLGSPVSFSVTAVGTAPLTYQWQQDDIDLPGETNNTLSIASIVDSDQGDYTVTVSNSVGGVISDPAVLTITHPPVVTSGPDNLIVNQGATATFTVSVNGATPFTYQWQKNLVDIPGANGKQLVLLNVTPTDAASYRVFITNSDGSTFSPPATLTVVVPPAITTQPVSQTNNVHTTVSFSVTTTGTSPTFYWFKNLTNLLVDGGKISGASSNVLTITNVSGADSGTYSLIASNQAGIAVSSNATLVVNDPIITNEPVSETVNLGDPASFTVGADGTLPQYQWQKDGVNIGGATSPTYAIAHAADTDRGNYTVIVSNIFGVVTSAPPVALIVIDPPVITNEPAGLTVNQGQTAVFGVGVSGTAPFEYQWFKNSNSIPNQTNATLTLLNVTAADEANYSVTVTNPAGSATSTPLAHLTVIIPPAIITQPLGLTNNATTTASFTVSVSGTSPSYQWYKNGTNLLTDIGNISGSSTTNLVLTNVLAADDGGYTVVAANAAGSVTSMVATLVVIDPVIFTQPVGTTNIDGSTVTFSVGAAGTTPLFYQWYQNNSALFGQTSSNLVLTNIADSDAGNYTVVVTNFVGSITSAPAVLVTVPPLIISQPTNLVVTVGQPANFSVNVNGQIPFTYQWQKNLANIPNATNRIFTIAATVGTDSGSYRVIVTNPNGTQISQPASLLVVVPPTITSDPTNVISFVGQNVNFTVGASSVVPPAYQWYFNSNSVPLATNPTLSLSSITTNNAGTYFAIVTNQAGSATSHVATLTIFATGSPSLTLVSYDGVNATISLVGVPGYNYAIQASTNLSAPSSGWSSLTTNASPYTFIDTNAAAFDERFYRAVLVP